MPKKIPYSVNVEGKRYEGFYEVYEDFEEPEYGPEPRLPEFKYNHYVLLIDYKNNLRGVRYISEDERIKAIENLKETFILLFIDKFEYI